MTDLRTAAQQALEALELGYDSAKAEADQYHAAMAGYRPQRHAQMDADVQKIAAAITALRAALAEPENWELRRLSEELERCKQTCAATSEAWREEAALAEPVQKPPEFPPHDDKVHAGAIYWYVGTDGKYYSSNEVKLFMEAKNKSLHYEPPKWVLDNFDLIPLYTAPPQRKPLTEEEIWALYYALPSDDFERSDRIDFARAVERAHGIDGAPEERNFCPRCGKRTNGIHTCTPPAPLTDEVIAELWHQNGGFHHHFARAIERWLKGNP